MGGHNKEFESLKKKEIIYMIAGIVSLIYFILVF